MSDIGDLVLVGAQKLRQLIASGQTTPVPEFNADLNAPDVAVAYDSVVARLKQFGALLAPPTSGAPAAEVFLGGTVGALKMGIELGVVCLGVDEYGTEYPTAPPGRQEQISNALRALAVLIYQYATPEDFWNALWGGLTPDEQAALRPPPPPAANDGVDDVKGADNCSDDFKSKVRQIASKLGLQAADLMAVMSFETGETFDPSVKSKSGTGAIGLIQFMPATATALGTTSAALAQMSAETQLDYVDAYYGQYKSKLAKPSTLEDAYMAVLYPAAIGQSSDYVLWTKGTTAYTQNAGLDVNGDGKITVGEATQRVREKL